MGLLAPLYPPLHTLPENSIFFSFKQIKRNLFLKTQKQPSLFFLAIFFTNNSKTPTFFEKIALPATKSAKRTRKPPVPPKKFDIHFRNANIYNSNIEIFVPIYFKVEKFDGNANRAVGGAKLRSPPPPPPTSLRSLQERLMLRYLFIE